MRLILAIASGLLLTVIFPTVIDGVRFPDLSCLAWIALVPLILACRGQKLSTIGALSFFTGLVYHSLVSYWIFNAMYFYGDLPAPASLGGVVGMALIFTVMLSVTLIIVYWMDRRGVLSLWISLPIFWTLYEWIRNYVPFGGYSWSELAYSQTTYPTLIQSADVFGIYGLTFLIVLVNVGVADVIAWPFRRRAEILPRRRPFPWVSVLVVVLLFQANMIYGVWRLKDVRAMTDQAKRLKVALVQPNIPQDLKWRPEQAHKTVAILTRLSKQAVQEGAELVIWPESAYPDALPDNLSTLNELANWKVPILFGAVTVQPPNRNPLSKRPLLQNSAIHIDPGGQIAGMYHKIHLVPFGEYIPLKNVLRFLEKIVPSIGDFVPGEKDGLLDADGLSYGVTICYEDLFPEISRASARLGAQFLTNITNDAWYGNSSAPWQHVEFSHLRAIENRRTMLRSTNTGVTAIIDPTGQVRAQLPLFKEGILVENIVVGGPETIYTRFGDVPWLVLMGLVVAISALIMNRRKEFRS